MEELFKTDNQQLIYTIGHSTRSIDEFIGILENYSIKVLVDVRRFPSSRKFPHFNKEFLSKKLYENDIKYIHMEVLGGRRGGGLNGYRDYLKTPQAMEGIYKLLSVFHENLRIAYMCAEKLPWKCHRWVLSEYISRNGITVVHIIEKKRIMVHKN